MGKQTKFTPMAKLFIIIFSLCSIIFINGCKTESGLMRLNEPKKENVYDISGNLNIPTIMETELAGIYSSLRGVLTTLKDYSAFTISANGVSNHVEKDGSFILKDVPFSDSLVVTATANKTVLMLRLTASDLLYTDLTAVKLNWTTTAEAYVYQLAAKNGKNITPGDIRAREYSDSMQALVDTLSMVAQSEPSSVSSNILEMPAVLNQAKSIASKVLEREIALAESNDILRNLLVLKNMDLFQGYISQDFTNDWDSTANWQDLINSLTEFYKRHDFEALSWTVVGSEFLPNNIARIRTRVTATTIDTISEVKSGPTTWIFDAYWRLEGNFWKLYRNLPYKPSDPLNPGASTTWEEIATVMAKLKNALATEDISVFQTHISQSFTNDFDSKSNYIDIITQAQTNFVEMDVKISEYCIESVEIISSDSLYADVKCSGRVKVEKFAPLIDIDSGKVSATIQWRKEDGVWKIYKNLPYRFSHKS